MASVELITLKQQVNLEFLVREKVVEFGYLADIPIDQRPKTVTQIISFENGHLVDVRYSTDLKPGN
jgi:hypothetical protein